MTIPQYSKKILWDNNNQILYSSENYLYKHNIDGTLIEKFSLSAPIFDFDINNECTAICLLIEDSIIVMDYETGEVMDSVSDMGEKYLRKNIRFSPNGRDFVFSTNQGRFEFWNIKNLHHVRDIKTQSFSDIAQFLSYREIIYNDGWLVKYQDLNKTPFTFRDLTLIPEDVNTVITVANDNDTLKYAYVGRHASKKYFRISSSNKRIRNNDSITALCYSPSSNYIVTGTADNAINIYNVNKGKIKRSLKDLKANAHAVAMSNDTSKVAAFLDNHNLIIWNIEENVIIEKAIDSSELVNSIIFSPNNKYIMLVYDNRLELWSIDLRILYRTLKGHFLITQFKPNIDDTIELIKSNPPQFVKYNFETDCYISSHIILSDNEMICGADINVNSRYCILGMEDRISIYDYDIGYKIFDIPSTGFNRKVFLRGQHLLIGRWHFDKNDNIVHEWVECSIESLNSCVENQRARFMNRQLAPEERRKYYLE